MVPSGWKQVQPKVKIIEAEFAVAAGGDAADAGRVTLMAAGGNKDDNIARWTGQFDREPGEKIQQETLQIDGREVTLVDIRGIFKDQSGPFAPVDPKANFRMLAAIIPLNEVNSYFVKLTGPKDTVGAHEAAFRELIKSANVQDAP